MAQIGVQTASALSYAHGRGIIHRDVKPGNLILDTTGNVWGTDFGLAKTGDSQMTHTGDILGTVRYMSPERFRGQCDVRADVYGLGMTLYELLTLKPAYSSGDRLKLIELIRQSEVASPRSVDARVPRDLETIVRKAIDKDAKRRYQSADEMGDDLQRFVNDEPIKARRISNGERLWRWCHHHPGIASLTAMLVLLLVGATLASLWAATYFSQLAAKESVARQEADQAKDREVAQRVEAEKAKQKEEAAKLLAEKNFAQALKAVDNSFTMVSESQLLKVPGMQPLRRELLQSALSFYQDFVKERGDDPELRGELAAAFLRVGKIRGELGDKAQARKAVEQALELYEALTKTDPESVEWRHGLAQCYFWLRRNEDAITLWEQLVQPGQPRFQKELAETYNDRGVKHGQADRLEETLKAYQQGLTIQEMLVRLTPDDSEAQRDLSLTLNNIGALLFRQKRLTDALGMHRRAAEHGEAAFARAPQVILNGRFLAGYQSNVARIERQLGHTNEALAAYRRAVEVWQKLARDNPAIPSVHSGLFGVYWNLALYQRELKQAEQARRTMRLARDIIDRLPSDSAGELYNLTCFRAVCSTYLNQGKDKATAEEQVEQKREQDLAMEALRQAIAGGYRDLDHLRKDPDLDALRDREDFKALEADLAARLPAPPPDKLIVSQQELAQRQKLAQADPKNTRPCRAATPHQWATVWFASWRIAFTSPLYTINECLPPPPFSAERVFVWSNGKVTEGQSRVSF